jgi:two-component system nitrate/nitrite response regulator NarL
MRILLIEDHPLFRHGLAGVLDRLDPDYELIERATARDALRFVRNDANLDLVLLDLQLGDENGLDHISALRNAQPSTPIVVVTASEDQSLVERAIANGAQGYIVKSTSAENVVLGLKRVLEGEILIPELAASPRRIRMVDPAAASRPMDHLTPRQFEVLGLISKGLSNKRIATELTIAETTVRVHVTEILKTLGASNRTEASYYAQSRGWL